MFISKRKLESLEHQIRCLNGRINSHENKVNRVEADIREVHSKLGKPEDGKHSWFGWDVIKFYTLPSEHKSIPPKELSMWETINQIMEATGLYVSKTNAEAKVVKNEEPKAPVKRKRTKKGKK